MLVWGLRVCAHGCIHPTAPYMLTSASAFAPLLSFPPSHIPTQPSLQSFYVGISRSHSDRLLYIHIGE